ncbi:hypothetical protein [Solibacillus sp. FSL K6-1554]|uniref:hypothetical protein n=1 Tax=Solibacillus sp. FSL K6-1554 TaxID=2921472 RepID=UPI0030F6BED8
MKNQIFNHFIGAIDTRDEYQQQEIYKELAFTGILLYYVTIVLMMVSLITDLVQQTVSIMTPILLIVNIGYSILIMKRINKKEWMATDCATPEEYEINVRRLKRSSTFGGISWGLMMLLFMEYLMPLISREEISFSWIGVISWGIGGALFGTAIYYISKSKLVKYYE